MAKSYDLSNLSFLIVDDNPHMVSIVRTILKGLGVNKVYETTSPVDALELLRQMPVDIVIAEYALETLDGLEFTHLVRTAQDSPNPYVPIIMLSAHTKRREVEAARDAGVTEFLAKPVSAKSLYRHVVEVIENPRSFIKGTGYVGPDRRRRPDEGYHGPERRQRGGESEASTEEAPASAQGSSGETDTASA